MYKITNAAEPWKTHYYIVLMAFGVVAVFLSPIRSLIICLRDRNLNLYYFNITQQLKVVRVIRFWPLNKVNAIVTLRTSSIT